MIPPFSPSGLLPPFVGGSSVESTGISPFHTSILEFVTRFCTSKERANLLLGLLSYRKQLRDLGFSNGYQWIDGSFCEDVETTRKRPPADIDLVNLVVRPSHLMDDAALKECVDSNPNLFNRDESKKAFGCDAYFIDGGLPMIYVAQQLIYWYGLFTHQRVSYQWKGIVQLTLNDDDLAAIKLVQDTVLTL